MMKLFLAILPLISTAAANVRARDVMALPVSPQSGVDMSPNPSLLFRRQSGCPTGYFACNNGISCAPIGGVCCSNGLACGPGEACCGYGCMPSGAECCSNGEYCPQGNICVIQTSRLTGAQRMVCCTDVQCTAYVDGGTTVTKSATTDVGSATIITTQAPATTFTATAYHTYHITFTWTYYFYYWTYSIAVDASVVTSSLTTTKSTFIVLATNDAAATSSADQMESTVTFTVPPQQTSLSAIAGETSSNPTASPTRTTTGSTNPTTTVVGVGGSVASGYWVDRVVMFLGMLVAIGAGALLM